MVKKIFITIVISVMVFVTCSPQTYAAVTLLHSFKNNMDDGGYPMGSLIRSGSKFYGMAQTGGDSTLGVIFSINTDGTGYTHLHEFAGGNDDGKYPLGTLVESSDVLYGMAPSGGDANCGIIFSINTNGTGFTILREFVGGVNDGCAPQYDNLIINGTVLYGVTTYGGDNNKGVVFSMNTNGSSFTLLREFSGLAGDGALPIGGLVLSEGKLYGTTSEGGEFGYGTVYSITTLGTAFTVLHDFTNDDGRRPYSSLLKEGNKLYGTTTSGGDMGVVFSIGTDGSDFTVLYSFTGDDDGSQPYNSLIMVNNKLYGMNTTDGAYNGGVLFSLNPDGTNFQVVHTFKGYDYADGNEPYGALLVYNSNFYGMTQYGGNITTWTGTIFSYPIPDTVAPSISVDTVTDPSSDPTPAVTGTATDSLSTVALVEYTMDCPSDDCSGVSWTACTADDTNFNESSEDFTCSVSSALIDGEHTIFIRATDSEDNTTALGDEASDTFTINYSMLITQSGGTTVVTEDGVTDSVEVSLLAIPSDTVTAAITSNNLRLSFTPTSLTFTPANWDTPQIVTFSLADDGLVEDNSTAEIVFTLSSNDLNYDSQEISGLSVSMTSHDYGNLITDENIKSIRLTFDNIDGFSLEDARDTSHEDDTKIITVYTNKPYIKFKSIDEDEYGVDIDDYAVRIQRTDALKRRVDSYEGFIEDIDNKSPKDTLKLRRDGYNITYDGDRYIRVKINSGKYKLSDGTYYLKIRATDHAGNHKDSDDVRLVVNSKGNKPFTLAAIGTIPYEPDKYNTYYFLTQNLVLSGTTRADSNVDTYINGEKKAQAASTSRGLYSLPITLQDGVNQISLKSSLDSKPDIQFTAYLDVTGQSFPQVLKDMLGL